MRWLWYFLIYSFLGFLLEIAFARATGHPKRDRKCFLLLPLCPVYGFGACLVVFLASLWRNPLWVMVSGGLAATGAELLMGLFYQFVLGVKFWDYHGVPGSVGGLICLRFSAYWTVLALILVYLVHPVVVIVETAIPLWSAPPAAILLGADALVSCVALRRTGSTEVLRWYSEAVPGE